MTALIVIGSILALLLLLLLCPMSIRISYRERLEARLSYLFFSIPLAPPKPKKEKQKQPLPKEEKKPEPEKKKSVIQDIIAQRGLGGFLGLMRLLSSIAAGALRKIFWHLSIRRVSLELVVAAEDAAQTAIRYGQASALVYPALGFLCANGSCKKREIAIHPGFNEEESRVDFYLYARIKLLYLLGTAFTAGFRLLKAMIKEKLQENKLRIIRESK